MTCATDLDGLLFAFPSCITTILCSLQQCGNKVGIISARPESEREQLVQLVQSLGLNPDFLVLKPDTQTDTPHGIWKAQVCNELGVDVLFDDFECNSDQMQADFFSHNTHTEAFTGWAYQPGKPEKPGLDKGGVQ